MLLSYLIGFGAGFLAGVAATVVISALIVGRPR
jgi:hypothetical protein